MNDKEIIDKYSINIQSFPLHHWNYNDLNKLMQKARQDQSKIEREKIEKIIDKWFKDNLLFMKFSHTDYIVPLKKEIAKQDGEVKG